MINKTILPILTLIFTLFIAQKVNAGNPPLPVNHDYSSIAAETLEILLKLITAYSDWVNLIISSLKAV